LIAGGGFNDVFLRYMATLTGKPRPRICYLPTAAADSPEDIIGFYQNCSQLNVIPFAQTSFISSYDQSETFAEVLLSMDNDVKRVVASHADAKVFYVSVVGGQVVEKELPAELIS
jgi:dipeptidase E